MNHNKRERKLTFEQQQELNNIRNGAIAFGKDVVLHTGMPTTGLMPKVGSNPNLLKAAPDLYEALDTIIKHFRTLDKLYSKDLEVLNVGSRALAKVEC